MTKSKKSTSPQSPYPSSNSAPRPKRRTAKVDYTEKKDYDFEVPNTTVQPSSTEQGTKGQDTEIVKPKRKYTKRNATSGASTRTDSPVGDDEDSSQSSFPINYQPEVSNAQFSHMLDLKDAVVKDGIELVLGNGQKLVKNDNIYLVCEPPGEPYYIGRIMGFVKKDFKHIRIDQGEDDECKVKTRRGKDVVESADGYKFKVNWYYRSRDISKHSNDSRLLYVSMHSDTCPLQSFRGKCTVKHKDEIENFEAFKSIPNQFWFDKLFDRYMIRFYDVLPTSQLTSLPTNYQQALMKRFPYIFVEQGKSKDMLQSPKSCAKCNQWCSHNDSIICCECQEMYHMLCLDPPLLKKPARGFAWSCIKCTKKLEGQKLIPNRNLSTEVDGSQLHQQSHEPVENSPVYEELAKVFLEKDSELSLQDRRNQEEWVYRYLGMHAKLEDALDLQDRPYPRAASRLGSKHQLTGVQDWLGHIVEYYDNSELPEQYQNKSAHKKKKVDGRKKKNASEEPEEDYEPLHVPREYKDMDPNEFPPWLQERPKGYIERGGEDTSTLMWRQPEKKTCDVDQYVEDCAPIAKSFDLLPNTPNFMDQILKNLLDCNYDTSKAQELNNFITRQTLKEPTFTKNEISKFEDGVRQFGSELYPVSQLVKTQTPAMVVRFYYLWKKTTNGHLIWDNFEGRRKTKNNKTKEVEDAEDLGHSGDDSSYDVQKTFKNSFQCKHCKTLESIQWFRSPGLQVVEKSRSLALCFRCARLWRRYAVIWEEPIEVLKKIGKIPGYGWKKKVESELLLDSELILKAKSEFNTNGSNSGSETPVKKRKQASAEPSGDESVKKSKTDTKAPIIAATTTASTTISELDSPTPEPKSEKEKRPYNKKSFEPKHQEEKPEVVISNILFDTPNVNLQQAILERYHHSCSRVYNSRVKFEDFPNQKSPLVSRQSSKLIKSVPTSRKCAVCLDKSDLNQSLFCYGCGINTHPQCYGVPSEDIKNPMGSYKWFCDPCSNKLNPAISSNYRCALCGINNDDEVIKAGLKRTNDGKWAHVLCALFNEHVKFANLETLQPITGLHTAIAYKYKHGPTIRSCHVCNKEITLSMAQQPSSNNRVGFRLNIENKPDSKCVKVNNTFGRLSLIVVCGEHAVEELDFEFLSLTSKVKRFKQPGVFTTLELYLDDFKRHVSNDLTGVQARLAGFQDTCKMLNRTETSDEIISNNKEPEFSVFQCQSCQRTNTLKWVKKDNLIICYHCDLYKWGNPSNGLDWGSSSDDPNKYDQPKYKWDISSTDPLKNKDNNFPEMSPIRAFDKMMYKILEVSNDPLNGENYGIGDPSERLIKPDFNDEEYTFDSQPPNIIPQTPGLQSLPVKNGGISEYRYYPPPPSDADDAPSPHLAMFMNGGLKLQRAGSVSTVISTPVPIETETSSNGELSSQAKPEEKKNTINSIMNTDQSIPTSPKDNDTATTGTTDNTTTTTGNKDNEKYVNTKMSIGSILG